MTDLRDRFRGLDSLRAPDLWSEVEARAMAGERKRVRSQPWALIAVVLLLGLLVGGIVLVGSGILRPARPSVWTVTGSMVEPRVRHTATLLPDGRVLAVGGGQFNGFFDLASAELYDPITGAWSATGTMAEVRWGHTATLLPDGTVLVAGGEISGNSPALASAELYDPRSGTWSSVGAMIEARRSHTATLLPSGRVLVAGGYNADGELASAELYDPATKSWTATGAMLTGHLVHTATLLQNGTVLVAGGGDGFGSVLASAELYDPDTGSWSPTGALSGARGGQTATLLHDGRVLVAGGVFGSQPVFDALATAEVYDPAAGVWSTAASMHTDRQYLTATLLPDGTVLVTGGTRNAENKATAEVYDPARDTWRAIADMHDARAGHSATLLPNGNVLVAGWTAEQYGPAVVPPHSTEPLPSTIPGETAGESATPVFADQGPVPCTNVEGGYSIGVPAGWWYLITNDSCGYLDPEPFTFVDDATPQGPVAIRISVVQSAVGSFYEIVSSEEITIAGHRTTRWELRAGGEAGGPPAGTLIYEYIVQLGATPEGPNLVAHTESANQPDYAQNKLVLDAIMATLTTP